MRHLLILIITIIVLAVINLKIYDKEQLLAKGTTVLLKLAPRDPRSLMQGDYMELRYDIASEPALRAAERDGYLVISIDDKQVANFKRIYKESTALATDEHLLQFRKREHDIRLGAESFFFQEGQAKCYENASYGEIRLAGSGESVLVGLRDAEFKRLQDICNNI
jgi:uncharacterized membrane-anchored protein